MTQRPLTRDYPVAALLVLVSAILLSGCDSFSLADYFTVGPPDAGVLKLSIAKTTMLRGEVVPLYPSGGTPPYAFQVIEEVTYHPGPGPDPLGTVVGQNYTAGTSIATVKIGLTDVAGGEAQVLVNIIPPPPANLSVVRENDNKNAVISWTYAEPDLITKFRLERAQNGGSFIAIALPGTGDISYTNTPLAPESSTYSYRLFAVAFDGFNESQSTPVVSSSPN